MTEAVSSNDMSDFLVNTNDDEDMAFNWLQLAESLKLEGIEVKNNLLGCEKEPEFEWTTHQNTITPSHIEALPELVGTFEDLAQAGSVSTSYMYPKNSLHTKIGGVSKYGGGSSGAGGGHKRGTGTTSSNSNNGSNNHHNESMSMNRLRQLHNWVNLDVKELTLHKEVTKLQTYLTGAQINEGVMNEIVRTYFIMQKVLRTNKKTIRTMKLFLSAAYYTMKRHFNPTPDEVAAIFRTDRKHVLQANRDNKRIAWLFKPELGFIFDSELGQTNLHRLASQYRLDRKVIREIVKECKLMRTSVLDSVTVRKLVLKHARRI